MPSHLNLLANKITTVGAAVCSRETLVEAMIEVEAETCVEPATIRDVGAAISRRLNGVGIYYKGSSYGRGDTPGSFCFGLKPGPKWQVGGGMGKGVEA